jgi:hypothetical protein
MSDFKLKPQEQITLNFQGSAGVTLINTSNSDIRGYFDHEGKSMFLELAFKTNELSEINNGQGCPNINNTEPNSANIAFSSVGTIQYSKTLSNQ